MAGNTYRKKIMKRKNLYYMNVSMNSHFSCYADSIQLGYVSPHDGHEAVIKYKRYEMPSNYLVSYNSVQFSQMYIKLL